jgi:hypothetical protein
MGLVGMVRCLVCVGVVVSVGCGDSDDPSGADAAVVAADAAAFVPTLGLWRIVSTGTDPMCETGGGPQSIALKRQHIFELTAATQTQVVWKTPGGVTFPCDGAGDNSFECTIPQGVQAQLGRPTYTIDYTSTSEVLSSTSATAATTSTTTCSGSGCASTTPCVDMVTSDFTLYVETEALVASVCGLEATLSSTEGFKETYVDFVNDTAAPLTRFWLDYNGTRRDFPDVPANTTVRTQTFETHSWIVENDSGTCLGIYTAGPDLNTITIQ